MRNFSSLIILCLLFVGLTSCSINARIKKADKKYAIGEYYEAGEYIVKHIVEYLQKTKRCALTWLLCKPRANEFLIIRKQLMLIKMLYATTIPILLYIFITHRCCNIKASTKMRFSNTIFTCSTILMIM